MNSYRKEWEEKLEFYDELIETFQWDLGPIRGIVHYICSVSYADFLFPGSSHETLFISKPVNGKMNFLDSLSIGYDPENNLLNFEYREWEKERGDVPFDEAVKWKRQCIVSEGSDTLDSFMEWKNWQAEA